MVAPWARRRGLAVRLLGVAAACARRARPPPLAASGRHSHRRDRALRERGLVIHGRLRRRAGPAAAPLRGERANPKRAGQLAARRDPELAVDAPEMHLHGLRREEQLGCDLAVGRACGSRLGDAPLRRGQRVRPVSSSTSVGARRLPAAPPSPLGRRRPPPGAAPRPAPRAAHRGPPCGSPPGASRAQTPTASARAGPGGASHARAAHRAHEGLELAGASAAAARALGVPKRLIATASPIQHARARPPDRGRGAAAPGRPGRVPTPRAGRSAARAARARHRRREQQPAVRGSAGPRGRLRVRRRRSGQRWRGSARTPWPVHPRARQPRDLRRG